MVYTQQDIMNDVLLIVLVVVCILLAMLGIPYMMTKRALGRVVKIFRRNNAIDKSTAKTIDGFICIVVFVKQVEWFY